MLDVRSVRTLVSRNGLHILHSNNSNALFRFHSKYSIYSTKAIDKLDFHPRKAEALLSCRNQNS